MKTRLQTAFFSSTRIVGLMLAGIVGFVVVLAAGLFAVAMTTVMLAPKARVPALRRQTRPEADVKRAISTAPAR